MRRQPTPPPDPSRSFSFNLLTDSQFAGLHAASLTILEQTGIRFYHEDALARLRAAGAAVSDGNLVRIPPRLVEWALGVAPKNVTLYSRRGQPALTLDGHHSYFGPGSDCLYILDLHTGERRLAVLNDVVDGVRLAEALPNVDFVMSMFLPSNVPAEQYERRQMEIMLRESSKPIIFVGSDAGSTRIALALAAEAAGGADALSQRPFVVNYVNTANCFHHNAESVQRLLDAAARNIPTIYAPGVSRGVTAPITRAGALAVLNAGQLAGLVLAQLVREGSPFIRNFSTSNLDLSTMVAIYASPDNGPFGWELARRYGLPAFGMAGCSNAKTFDAQAAGDAALTLFANLLAGAGLIHDLGYLDGAMTGSLELLAYCDELIGWLRRWLTPLELDAEQLALDLIECTAPDGQYLEADHTLRHVRDSWQPILADRLDYARWYARDGRTLQQHANARVRTILERSKRPL